MHIVWVCIVLLLYVASSLTMFWHGNCWCTEFHCLFLLLAWSSAAYFFIQLPGNAAVKCVYCHTHLYSVSYNLCRSLGIVWCPHYIHLSKRGPFFIYQSGTLILTIWTYDCVHWLDTKTIWGINPVHLHSLPKLFALFSPSHHNFKLTLNYITKNSLLVNDLITQKKWTCCRLWQQLGDYLYLNLLAPY